VNAIKRWRYHRNAYRSGCRGILTGCPQEAPEAARLVAERDADHEHGADCRLEQIGRFGYGRERVRAGPDLLVVAQDVMRDLEHPERRDAGGKAGQPHQRQPYEKRVDPSHPGGDQERWYVADRVVAQEREQVGHDRRLLGDRDGEHACRPRADGDEADVAERDDAGVADEDVERDDDRHRHERADEVDLRCGRRERAEQSGEDDEQHRPAQLDRAAGAHTRST